MIVTNASGEHLEVTLCSLRPDEYTQCDKLQHLTWGKDFREQVPPSMMKINVEKLGGVLAGALTPDRRLLAFVYGMTGIRDGHPFHWSHLLAVEKGYENLGLGRELKLFQRRFVLALGVNEMEWTYDPLESRNAHLNLNRLGAKPIAYLHDVYGDGSRSPRHTGIGTDRFVVHWKLRDPEVEARVRGDAAVVLDAEREAPIVNVDATGKPLEPPFDLPALPLLRAEIPADIGTVKSDLPSVAKRWRAGTRFAFEYYLRRGYRISSLSFNSTSQRSFYVLKQP